MCPDWTYRTTTSSFRPLSFAPPFGFERESGVTGFLAKIVADFPVGDRIIPFVSGGGGVGRVTEELSFDFRDRPGNGFFGLPELFRNIGDRRPSIFPRDFETAETGLALTLGGGVDIRLWKGLTVGGEARWLRVLAGTRSIDLAHIGSRVAYRFQTPDACYSRRECGVSSGRHYRSR
jgi:opacity protein-like surface antigen